MASSLVHRWTDPASVLQFRVFFHVPADYRIFGTDCRIARRYWEIYSNHPGLDPSFLPNPRPVDNSVLEALGHILGFHYGDGTAGKVRVIAGAYSDQFIYLLEQAALRLSLVVRYGRISLTDDHLVLFGLSKEARKRLGLDPMRPGPQFTSLVYFGPDVPSADCARHGFEAKHFTFKRPFEQEAAFNRCRDDASSAEIEQSLEYRKRCLAGLAKESVCSFQSGHHPLAHIMREFLYTAFSQNQKFKGIKDDFFTYAAQAPVAFSRGFLQGLADSDGTVEDELMVRQTSDPVRSRSYHCTSPGHCSLLLAGGVK